MPRSLYTYGPEPIVDNGLVLHIDPANPISVGSTQRADPMSGITDMKKDGRVSYATSSVSSAAYTPAWESNFGGTIRFDSTDNSSSFGYGYIDLGTPVVGITSFSTNDCYTVDFWWKQDTVSNTGDSLGYMYSGGTIYGPRERYINVMNGSSAYNTRNERSPLTISIGTPIGNGGSTTAYRLILKAFQELWSNNTTLSKQYTFMLSSSSINFNTWNHVCGVFDLGDSLGTGIKAYLYLNGKLNNAVGVTSVGSDPFTFDQNGPSQIGSSNLSYNPTPSLRGNGAKGEMGPFKIYNRALTQNEITQNYNSLKDRYKLTSTSGVIDSGQSLFTSDGTFTVPDGVITISAVCIGAGGGGSQGGGGWSGAGGGGGALSYKNNISVTPGEILTIVVGDAGEGGTTGGDGGDSQIKRSSTVLLEGEGGEGGGYRSAGGEGGETSGTADGGGDGGNGGTATQNALFQEGQGGGGGGAGGYSGKGGNGGYGLYNGSPGSYLIFPTNGTAGASGSGAAGGGGPTEGTAQGGGGTGIIIKGETGPSASRNSHGEAGSGGTDGEQIPGNYGGGAGGRRSTGTPWDGAGGAIRIIFGDYFTDTRSYPSNSANA